MSLTITEVSGISFAGSLRASLLDVLHEAADRHAKTTENTCEAIRNLNIAALNLQTEAQNAATASLVGTNQSGKVQLS